MKGGALGNIFAKAQQGQGGSCSSSSPTPSQPPAAPTPGSWNGNPGIMPRPSYTPQPQPNYANPMVPDRMPGGGSYMNPNFYGQPQAPNNGTVYDYSNPGRPINLGIGGGLRNMADVFQRQNTERLFG